MFLLSAIIGLAVVGLPLWALILVSAQGGRIQDLERRIARLESAPRGSDPALAAVPPPPPESGAPAPAPIPLVPPAPPATPASHGREPRSLEQLVGGIWLQNAGSVLLLLGSFFLIVWGYTTGRIGPSLLVAAGVALGLALAWRGDRAARRLPAFGHALIGVGLGVVYLTFHLGHATLRVLPAGPAFALLALTSLAALMAGLRYRSEAVAALGVLGAFLPRLLATFLSLRGFALGPAPLLAYLAVVDAAVLATAAHPAASNRWARGRLVLGALLLTTITWLLAFAQLRWGWSIEIALSALFAGLGLVAVPRLARSGARPPAAVLAVIAAAPLGWLAASWPFIAFETGAAGGALLLAMALLWMAAAAWVEPRPAGEDLWRALTAAAVLFITTALQRALGTEQTPMAWCLEAAALVWLGLRGRAWLRSCGYLVGTLGAVWLLVRLGEDVGWSNDRIPILYPDGLRNLASLAALIAIAALVGRRGAALTGSERLLGRVWTVGGNLLVLVWSAVESRHVAGALHGTGGHWARPPSITDLPSGQQLIMLAAVMTSIAWLAQAVVLLALGWRQADAFLRWLGLGLFGFTVAKFLFFDLATVDFFWRFLIAILVGAALLGVSYLYQRRARRGSAPPGPMPPGPSAAA